MSHEDSKHGKEIDALSGIETTGHEWDGLKELNHPAPRWWLWVFYVCILFAIGYWVVYPAWPTLSGYTGGAMNWSEYAELKEQQGEIIALRADNEARLAAASLQDVKNDTQLYNYALAGGAVAFKDNCAACHGSGGQGGKGFPNLNDDEWVWGGTLDQIATTIRYGARNENPQTHGGAMAAWKDSLKPDEIENVAAYVQKLYMGDKAEQTPERIKGKEIFAQNCAACHGESGEGNADMGAPQLSNDIWLFGGDRETLVQTIAYGRAGVMPAWEGRLSDSTIKQLTVYVHSLGGGK